MTYTLLFDLDDTLLDTSLEAFIPAYFQAFSSHLERFVSSDIMLPALLSATRLMVENNDPSSTLQEVFEMEFYSKIEVSKQEIMDDIEIFYDEVFPNLSVNTKPYPHAIPLIEWALSQGCRIAIATDPLFPKKATYHRLRWAGFDPEQFELVSTFENFHFSKTHAAYYAEMLGHLGWPDGPVLMIGNDIQRDIIPADRLGLKTFYVRDESTSSPGVETGSGNLADLCLWLESQTPSDLEPSFKSPEAIMAIMSSTPAALSSLTRSLTDDQWQSVPTQDDWAMNEIICHLRDTELEVHRVQLQLMIEKAGAFIPRPDSSVWANERKYVNVKGPVALAEFTNARIQNLDLIKKLDSTIWKRSARHAIFGPTNFLEVLKFIAEHDRAHLQQVWKTLKNVQSERV